MAEQKNIQIEVDNELLKIIQWLQSYKNAADEALTYFTAKDVDDDYLREGQKIALRALNIGANDYPLNFAEDDFIIRLFLKAWLQEDYDVMRDKLPDWIEMEDFQFRDVIHRFANLLTEINSKPAINEE